MHQLSIYLKQVLFFLIFQLFFVLVISVILFLIKGKIVGYSGFIGGMIAWIPNAYFAYKAFKYQGALSIKLIVKSFYSGEVGKIVITALLFTITFIFVDPLSPMSLFFVYLLILMANWVVPFIIRNKFTKP